MFLPHIRLLLAVSISCTFLAHAQSIPGASLFVGGGTPGGTYSLVDDYEPSTFFNKFNYYDVSIRSEDWGLGVV